VAGLILLLALTALVARRQGAESALRALPPKSFLRSDNAYLERREHILATMRAQSFCADIKLSPAETNVDGMLSQVRSNETFRLMTAGKFPPARMFFEAKADIEQSSLFPVLRRMPKGALLHVHESSSGRCEFVLTNIARRADCFIYWTTNAKDGARGTLIFTNVAPTNYQPVNVVREQLRADGISLDDELRGLYMLDHSDPHDPDIWNAFARWFMLLPQLMTYQPVMQDYMRDAFKTLHEDGIGHVDLRVMAPAAVMFDLKGTTYTEQDTLRAYVAARDYIRAHYNSNFTLRLIMTGYRGYGNDDTKTVVTKTHQYQQEFPELIVGCDFVGEEDNSLPTLKAMPELRKFAHESNSAVKFYFHDGETAWPGNDNLLDAVMLGTKRLGHGFNLFQLPAVEAMVKTNHIAIEVCPISNQLLRLMHDLRVHPAVGYMNRGVPCVLGSDDPAIFGNTGLSYDFWEAYYAWGLDLRGLKQLAQNSILHSALGSEEQAALLVRWNQQWNEWIQWVNANPPVAK
jgi:adenosine deaminase CECR1